MKDKTSAVEIRKDGNGVFILNIPFGMVILKTLP